MMGMRLQHQTCRSFQAVPVFVLVLHVLLWRVDASHFRGGSISWQSVEGRKVKFNFMTAWQYGQGPGCTADKIGQFVSEPMANQQYVDWICQKGCQTQTPVGPNGYVCLDASKEENWEQGEADFLFTFPDEGPFHVGYSGSTWQLLNKRFGGGGGDWNIFTKVDLRTRSDTGKINSSPMSLTRPLYHKQFGCSHELPITVIDSDGDNVRCRWAVGKECKSVCHGLPGARLDQEKCTIHFEATFKKHIKPDTLYAIALTIEDFPRSTISLGNSGDIKTPSDSLSSIPLQYLIKTVQASSPCRGIPRFVAGTPSKDDELVVEEGSTFTASLFADNGEITTTKVESIKASGVPGMTQSPLTPDPSRPNTFQTTLTWTPKVADVGRHIVCAHVENEKKTSGVPSCFTLTVVPRPCRSGLCENGGRCKIIPSGNRTCMCAPGYMGAYCQIDIDDCSPNPCQNGARCVDGIDSFTCACTPGYAGITCGDVDDCSPNLCQNGARCVDGVNSFTCLCLPGYTGVHCQTDVDDCSPNLCQNGARCVDGVNSFTCLCLPGYTGVHCQTDVTSTTTSTPSTDTSIRHSTTLSSTAGDTSFQPTTSSVHGSTPSFSPTTSLVYRSTKSPTTSSVHGSTKSTPPFASTTSSVHGSTKSTPSFASTTSSVHASTKTTPSLTSTLSSVHGSTKTTPSSAPTTSLVHRSSNMSSTSKATPSTTPYFGRGTKEYDCRCGVSDCKTPPSGNGNSLRRHFLAGLVGFPIGLGLSLATFYLVRRNRGKCVAAFIRSQARITVKEPKTEESSPHPHRKVKRRRRKSTRRESYSMKEVISDRADELTKCIQGRQS